MKSSRADRSALFLMAFTILVWAFAWIVMKRMALYIGAFDLVMLRYAFGFLVLFAILVASRKSITFPPFWLTLGIAVFQTTAFQCLAQFALLAGGAGHVVMLAYTMPFWLVIFARMLLGERPTKRHAFAFIFAGLGLVAVIAPWEGLGSMASSLLALGAGISWALGTVLSKIMFQRHAPDVLNLTTWQMFLGALLTVPFAFTVPQPAIDWQPELIWGLAYIAVMASAVGWWLWLALVRRVSATAAGMSSLGVPILTIIFAWVLLAERPTPLELTGIALMMAGLIVVNLSPARHAR